MKKIIIFALTALMCFSLAACDGDEAVGQPAEKTEDTITRAEITDIGNKSSAPRVQDIVSFLDDLKPYYDKNTDQGDSGTFRVMNYTLVLGGESLIDQYITSITSADYDLSLNETYVKELEEVTHTYYYIKYNGDSQEYFNSEDMEYHINIAVSTYKYRGEAEITFGYADGFEYVDDGHRADYSKVIRPVTTPEPTQKPASQNTDNYTSLPSPKIQDIRKFLALDTPYHTDMGTYGSMDFLYSLEHGEEELIEQFIDTLVIGGYGLNLVDISKYDFESTTFKNYEFMYRGKDEKKLQRENMNWDVSIGITVHKDSNEVVAGIFYVNGFELVDDGHRADYLKVEKPASTPKPSTPSGSNSVSANKDSNGGGGTTPNYERNELPDHSKLQCLTCRGSGDCKECGGSIYVYVGGARTKCNHCKGSGNCRTCGGSGTRG